MTHLLDTDHITFLQRQDGREWELIVGHIARVGAENVAVSVVSYHEQFLGIHSQLNQVTDVSVLPRWYRRMAEMLDLYARANLLVLDDAAALVLAMLKPAIKPRLKPMDLRIAAIALSDDLTAVTRNASDFGRVPNLRIEDWSR